MTFGSSFVMLLWRVAVWKTKLENDVDNLGYIVGTEKGKDLHEKKVKKTISWNRFKNKGE